MQSLSRALAMGLAAFLAGSLAGVATGQQPGTKIRLVGEVLDPTGARVPHAAVSVLGSNVHVDAETNAIGEFTLLLLPGDYALIVDAAGFGRAKLQLTPAEIASGHRLDVHLAIATRDELVDVAQEGVGTSAGENQSATVLGYRELLGLSDDEGTFQKELQAMAGGLSGTANIFVDGFSGAKIPPKASIQAVRINHDPYSAQYDSLGFGRLEIESRAGGQQVHGGAGISGTQQAINAQDPFTPQPQPAYYLLNGDANVSGPLGRRSTYFVSGVYNNVQNNAAVNALLPTVFSEAIPDPQVSSTVSLRADRQFSPRNTITGRYELDRVTLTNGSVGQLILPSEGYASATTVQTLQVAQESILNARTVNQLRFEYVRSRQDQHPEQTDTGLCTSPLIASCTVVVEGAFSGGGDPAGLLTDHRDHLEGEDFVSLELRSHFLRLGARYRWNREASTSTGNFNGQFIFSTLAGYLAGQPSQFNLTTGDPRASASTHDVAGYADDEWKLTRDVTLDYGLRVEYQTAIGDHPDPAPRASVAWAPRRARSKTPLVVLRTGAGLFYDRFQVDQLLIAAHENGLREQIGFVTDPATLRQIYTQGFTSSVLTSASPFTYRIAPHLKPASELVATLAADRRIGHYGTLSASYMWGRGVHQYLSENANAPAPGTGLRPLGGSANVYQFASDGVEKDQVGLVNWRLVPVRRLTVYGLYIAQDKRSSGQGAAVFASNSYNVGQDFGRIPSARRQQLFAGALITLPRGFSATAYFSWQSGAPFNITTGTDLNGDTIYNDRPSFATTASPAGSVVATRYGTFNVNPQPGEALIPSNYGTGPGLMYLSTSVTKSYTLGGHYLRAEPGKPARREGGCVLGLTLEADNLTNNVNAAPPDGVLNSALFGRSLAQDPTFSPTTAANRILFLRAHFSF